MKRMALVAVLFSLALIAGCASMDASPGEAMAASSHEDDVRQDRMLIWRSWITLEVYNVSNTAVRAIAVAEASEGYIERRSDSGAGSCDLTIRVPSSALKTAIASLETLGTVTYRRLSSEDVTEKFIDTQARLKNRVALRDRLRELLQKATDVQDILALEKELHRIQGEIDSMEGRLKAMKGQVDYATINLSIRGKVILGPLGYAFKGAWWVVEKLFVIRDGS